MERRTALLAKSSQRRSVLEDSYRLQQFERDCDETKGWINEKLKFANDDSYLVSIYYCYYFDYIKLFYEITKTTIFSIVTL